MMPPSRAIPPVTLNDGAADFELSTQDIATIDALDRAPDGRVGPNPDTYEGV